MTTFRKGSLIQGEDQLLLYRPYRVQKTNQKKISESKDRYGKVCLSPLKSSQVFSWENMLRILIYPAVPMLLTMACAG